MTQERVGRDLELDSVSALVPARVLDDAHERVVLRLGRREGAEVVVADQHRGRGAQLLRLDAPRMPEGAIHLEGRVFAPPPDAIAV